MRLAVELVDENAWKKGRLPYLTYFAAAGSVMPFLVLFLERNGLTPTSIGLLRSLAAAAAIIPGFLWVSWSDRLMRRRPFLLFGFAVQMVAWLIFPLLSRFYQFLILMVAMSALIPPVEALMNVWILGKLDRGKLGTGYSLVRIWGSIGWIIATVVVGALVETTDIRFAFVIGAGLISLLIIQPIHDDGKKPEVKNEATSRTPKRRSILPFGIATVIRAFSVGMTYTFLSVYLDRIGTPFWLIGWGWAISALPEIPLMVLAGRLSDKIGRMPLLIAGFTCSSIMAFIFAFIDRPALAVPLMSLSGVSYALTYISSVGFLADVAPHDKQATAQGVFSIITTYLPRVAGPFTGGLIIDIYGLDSMFLLAGTMTMFAAIMLLASKNLWAPR